jgi:hypothetical protein
MTGANRHRQLLKYEGAKLAAETQSFEKLIFLHLEKTAGMSTRRFLSGLFGGKAVSPHCDERDFADFVPRYPVIVGHVGLASIEIESDEFRWFTILRDPVRRILSLMNFWAQQIHDETPYWTAGTEIERDAYSLANSVDCEAFLSSSNPKIIDQVRNLACRRFAGRKQGDLSDQDFAELAFEKLENDALFFGLQEQYHLSMLQLPLLLDIPIAAKDFAESRTNRSKALRHSGRDALLMDHPSIAADTILFSKAKTLFARRMDDASHRIFNIVAGSNS